MKILFNFLMAAVVLLGAASELSAQIKTFKWSDEICEIQGTYDSKKYSAAELRDTRKLVQMMGLLLNFDAAPRSIIAAETLDINELEREYAAKKAEIQRLKIVRIAFFENLRQKKLAQLERYYQFLKITAQAWKNPQILKTHKTAPACVERFADPLTAGGDALLSAWLEVNLESRRNNGNPENLRRIYEEQFNSADRLRYARSEVMGFGWWNCVTKYSPVIDYDREQKEFAKLFIKTRTLGCDQP